LNCILDMSGVNVRVTSKHCLIQKIFYISLRVAVLQLMLYVGQKVSSLWKLTVTLIRIMVT
jgi:hypothetical protein